LLHLILLFRCIFLAFQQLDIDYVIGESHKEFLPKSSGPAAIIRIFGVTKEGYNVLCSNKFSLLWLLLMCELTILYSQVTVCAVRFMGLNHISTSVAHQGWVLMIFHASNIY
jgi:hypothetical protein